MKILITGGAGFIGSHLACSLMADGHEVIVLDDLSTGSMDNLTDVFDKPGFDFFQDTVCNDQLVKALVNKCDQVYHLAAAVGVQLIVQQPVRTIETNIHGTEVLLEAANEYGKKILIASTSEVYGKNETVPFREDDDMLLGSTRFSRWSYACSKAIDEFLALAFHNQYGLDVVVTRFFNTIGPRQTGQYGMVVPRFVKSALLNEPICIYGSGRQSRCFSYVGDIIRGARALMETPGTGGEVYNLGSDEEITIEGLADLIIEMTGSSSKKQIISYEQAYGRSFDDMMRRIPSIEKAKKAVDFEPRVSLYETLEQVIEYMRGQIGL